LTEFHKRSSKSRKNQQKSLAMHLSRRRSPEDQKRLKDRARKRNSERQGAAPRRRDWADTDEDRPAFEKTSRTAPERSTPAQTPAAHPATQDKCRATQDVQDTQSALPASSDAADTWLRGQLVSVQQGRVQVTDESGTWDAELGPELAAVQQTAVAVGDEVLWERIAGSARIREVLPRRTTLSRPDPGNRHRRRVLAANVDLAVLVLCARRPAFRPGLVDRFLVALDRGGVKPLVVVNKLDLASDTQSRADLQLALAPYPPLGVPTIFTSAESGEGMAPLRNALEGLTSVFVGHSGVGKSSLLNALDPQGRRDTSRGRHGDGKGRHTTTSSCLSRLRNDTRVIDTPGVRAFGLWSMSPADVRAAFPEFERHAAGCRFRDCSHLVEPECAVQAARRNGLVPTSRMESYARILASLE
jgi:ribosome biogenesis GTPase